MTQIDAYYAHPASSFYDDRIERRFYEQKLRHIGWKPYPNDGAITFGASGTSMCDRQLVFKNDKAARPEKDHDIPFRGRQRRQGNAVVDFFQLDFVHMPKRIGEDAVFRMKETDSEWLFEDAAQTRKVFEHPHPETGEVIRFAITAKPDGLFEYVPEGRPIIFEFKTKASGLVEMNGRFDFKKSAQDDHIRQTVAESLLFGIDDVLIVYESNQKPAWFSDEESKNVPKTRKTWRDGEPIPDVRAFHFVVTESMRRRLLDDLAVQAALVYENKDNGAVPDVTVESTGKCGFCVFRRHCYEKLTDENRAKLERAEQQMASSSMAGKFEHRNLSSYLEGVKQWQED